MNGRVFSFTGFLGIIATLIVSITVFSSKDSLRIPFVIVGILISLIIIALGEIIYLLKNQNNGGFKK